MHYFIAGAVAGILPQVLARGEFLWAAIGIGLCLANLYIARYSATEAR